MVKEIKIIFRQKEKIVGFFLAPHGLPPAQNGLPLPDGASYLWRLIYG